MILDKPTAIFEQHREEFAKNHHGKIVVIHNTEVAGFSRANEKRTFLR